MSKITQEYQNKTVVYVNFSPYENAGRILDYLTETFENVLLFSFNFHSLGKKYDKSRLQIIRRQELQQEYPLYQLNIPSRISLVFLLLPLRSLLISAQIIWHLVMLKSKFRRLDYYFTVNAFTAVTGQMLKKMGIVDKTIFWVWDYYPPLHENKIVMLMRWLYWQFDKLATHADKVIFLNQRLRQLRKDIGVLPQQTRHEIVPIGTDPLPKITKKPLGNLRLGFIGVLKKSQGLDLVFDKTNKLQKSFRTVTLEVVGSGPDESYFKSRAKKTGLKTSFYGYIPDQKEVKRVMSRWNIGIATYIPEESNVSYYGDPSKIKMYLSLGIPVITTNVFSFSNEIKSAGAGVVVDYFKDEEFLLGVKKITSKYELYQKKALRLAKKYFFKRIYQEMFR